MMDFWIMINLVAMAPQLTIWVDTAMKSIGPMEQPLLGM